MAQNTQTFILVGDFKDNITPKLRKLDKAFKDLSKQLDKNFANSFKALDKGLNKFEKNTSKIARNLNKELSGITKGFDKGINKAGRSLGNLETSMNEVGRSAGKVRDIVSTIGENHKGFDSMAESMAGVSRAAGRARDEVDGMAEGLGKAQGKAENLMETLLKAEGLSKMGDAVAQGFSRGFGTITGVARKGAGFVAAQYKKAMEDEMADIKATTSVQGSFTRAGFKGGAEGGGLTYEEAGKFYKKFDVQIAEMIRTSSAPTSKVVELQRFTMDTLGPLLLAAENVPKGTNVKDITPDTIKKVSTTYGGMLEQIALLAQGTGTATFRVAQGVEGLIKSGKIDTTMDFFTDNILLMQALQDAGFAGGGAARGGRRVATITNEADRLKALQKALETAQSREGIKKMSESLTGSIQGLMDTLTNPSVGVFGMATTFSEQEQGAVDIAIKKVYSARIKDLQKELKNAKKGTKRREQLEKDIEREQAELDYLTKEGASQITSPFKAFNLMFGKMIRSLTEALNAIGPIWNRFAVTAIEWTDKFLRPLDIALKNVASNMRADFKETGGKNQAFNIGRIFGEIYKFIGAALGDLATALTDPKGALGKSQSQFMQGFYDAFKEKGSFEKAKKGMVDGITALVTKLFQLIGSILTSEEMRPIVTPFVMAMFGPPVISAVISGITPLLIAQSGTFFAALFAKARLLSMPKKPPVPPRVVTPSQRLAGIMPTAASAAAPAAGGAAAANGAAGGTAAKAAGTLAGTVAIVATAAIVFEKPLLALAQWMTDMGEKLRKGTNIAGNGFAVLLKGLGALVKGLVDTFNGAFQMIVGLVTGDIEKVKQGFVRMMNGIAKALGGLVVSVIGIATTMGGTIIEVVKNLFRAIWEGVMGIKNQAKPDPVVTGSKSRWNAQTKRTEILNAQGQWVAATAKGSDQPFYGNLGQAISHEMANKPKGSDLVIANSSETIIPAAGGLDMGGGMKGVIDAIWRSGAQVVAATTRGFDIMNKTIAAGDAKNASATMRSGAMTKAAIDRSIAVSMAGDAKIMSAIKAASAAGGLGGGFGGALGSASGNLQSAAGIAKGMGLTMTSYKRNGPPNASYHNVGRAMDFSNSTGPTPQMMQFAQTMAARYGSSMAELIYTPLGFSIKNGKKVAPYAQAGHYNHVHVAFAHGLENPRLFSSAKAAAAYEGMYAPPTAKVSTITANSSEKLGGQYNISQNIVINGADDPRRLAEMVFNYAAQAAEHINNSSFA